MRILPFPLLLVTLAAAAMAGLACNDHDAQPVRNENFGAPGDDGSNDIPPEKAADATPTPTAILPVSACPVEDSLCSVATEFETRLRQGSASDVVRDARGYVRQCRANDDDPPDVCVDNAGDTVDAFLIGGNHREALSLEAFEGRISEWMRSGADILALRPVSIGCLFVEGETSVDCSTLVAIAYQALPDTGPVILAFRRDPAGSPPSLFAVLFEAPNNAVTRGGVASLGLPFVLGIEGDVWFTPWDGR
jgi:hypothetical protein